MIMNHDRRQRLSCRLLGSAPALCIDVSPTDPDRMLVGDMSGNTVVASVSSGDVIYTAERHGKYVHYVTLTKPILNVFAQI